MGAERTELGTLAKSQLRAGYRSFPHPGFGGAGEGVTRRGKSESISGETCHPFSGFRPLSKLPAQKQPQRAGNRSS